MRTLTVVALLLAAALVVPQLEAEAYGEVSPQCQGVFENIEPNTVIQVQNLVQFVSVDGYTVRPQAKGIVVQTYTSPTILADVCWCAGYRVTPFCVGCLEFQTGMYTSRVPFSSLDTIRYVSTPAEACR